jgi:hypothetical protein
MPSQLHSRKMKGAYTVAIAPMAKTATKVVVMSKTWMPHKVPLLQQRDKEK